MSYIASQTALTACLNEHFPAMKVHTTHTLDQVPNAVTSEPCWVVTFAQDFEIQTAGDATLEGHLWVVTLAIKGKSPDLAVLDPLIQLMKRVVPRVTPAGAEQAFERVGSMIPDEDTRTGTSLYSFGFQTAFVSQ